MQHMQIKLKSSHTQHIRWQRFRIVHDQRGVVLIVGMIMLGIISLMAAYTVRGTTLTEKISANARTSAMAQLSAEAALRWCEKAVLNQRTVLSGATVTYVASDPYTAAQVRMTATAAPALGGTLDYESYSLWNTSSVGNITVLDMSQLSLATGTSTFAVYKRPPECMAQLADTVTYVITARGFGPDVSAADANRSPPQGAEVFLQSFIRF